MIIVNASALKVGISFNNSETTLLPTAIMPIMLKDGNSYPARSLFDQGSQKSFVLRKLSNFLKMRVVSSVKEKIDSFHLEGKLCEYDIVEFFIFL